METTISPTGYVYDVDMDEICVGPLTQQLKTGGMSTCSALVVVSNKQQLLSHVSCDASVDDLKEVITAYFDVHAVGVNFFVIPGDGDGNKSDPAIQLSLNKINSTLSALEVPEQSITQLDSYTDQLGDVVVTGGVVKIVNAQENGYDFSSDAPKFEQ